jgi:hypothetical protein
MPNGPLHFLVRRRQHGRLSPAPPPAATSKLSEECDVRPILALLGGLAISITGLGIVLDTAWELAGVAMILCGVLVAVQGMRIASSDGTGVTAAIPSGGPGRDSMVGWPSGLGSRLAHRGQGRRRVD